MRFNKLGSKQKALQSSNEGCIVSMVSEEKIKTVDKRKSRNGPDSFMRQIGGTQDNVASSNAAMFKSSLDFFHNSRYIQSPTSQVSQLDQMNMRFSETNIQEDDNTAMIQEAMGRHEEDVFVSSPIKQT